MPELMVYKTISCEKRRAVLPPSKDIISRGAPLARLARLATLATLARPPIRTPVIIVSFWRGTRSEIIFTFTPLQCGTVWKLRGHVVKPSCTAEADNFSTPVRTPCELYSNFHIHCNRTHSRCYNMQRVSSRRISSSYLPLGYRRVAHKFVFRRQNGRVGRHGCRRVCVFFLQTIFTGNGNPENRQRHLRASDIELNCSLSTATTTFAALFTDFQGTELR